MADAQAAGAAHLKFARAGKAPPDGPALPDPVRLRPQRNAVLLIGGDKTGNEQWYETSVPLADRLYERHLIELEESDDHGKSKKL